MIKKLLFALATIFISTLAVAQQQVPSAWAFNIANVQGSYYRALLEQANLDQKKYQFVPEHKPGAGGSIAAAYVNNNERLALLGTATAFFVRPYLHDNAGYTFDQFKPVYLIANSPLALTTKSKDLKTILAQDKISIGTAGPGSGTHLFALKFKAHHPNKEVVVVPYKSSTEALQDVLGGHIDLAYEFLGDAEARGVKILGITGTKKIKNYPMLKDTVHPDNAEFIGIYHVLVKKDVPDEVVRELREIFNKAEKSARFQELYKSDYSFKPTLKTDKDYTDWYNASIKTYRATITPDMKLD
jgi:tripartite-type tricarboxylate transporter receptor subunit TctC